MTAENFDDISPIDNLIGLRIRLARKDMKMTQSDLAEKLEVSFQQVQKYESGQNKVYASRLLHISKILHRPIPYFYGLNESGSAGYGLSDNNQDGFSHENGLPDDYTVKVLRRLSKVPSEKRQSFVEMVERMADMSR